MTFIHLSLLLVIFFLIFPAKIKQPNNIQYYSEYDIKLRSKIAKIYYFLNLLVICFYVATFVLVSFYPHLFKRAV
jgi:hypothetical protein